VKRVPPRGAKPSAGRLTIGDPRPSVKPPPIKARATVPTPSPPLDPCVSVPVSYPAGLALAATAAIELVKLRTEPGWSQHFLADRLGSTLALADAGRRPCVQDK